MRGDVRVTVGGELPPDVDFHARDLAGVASHLDSLVVRAGGIWSGYDLGALAREASVRGQFVRDVQESDLPEEERRRVIVTGLRALDGRDDLEVA
jgi:exonuclease SbcD